MQKKWLLVLIDKLIYCIMYVCIYISLYKYIYTHTKYLYMCERHKYYGCGRYHHIALLYSTFSLAIKLPSHSSRSFSLYPFTEELNDGYAIDGGVGWGGCWRRRWWFSGALSCNSPHNPCESAILTPPTHPLLSYGSPPSHELDTTNKTMQLPQQRG